MMASTTRMSQSSQFKLNRKAPKDSDLFKHWHRVFDELAHLLGLTLAVYDKDEYLLGISRANPICANVQLDEKGCANCERDCGGMLNSVPKRSEFTSFKC